MTYNPYDYSKQSGIYCFVCKINDKKYIGQSVNLLDRYGKHRRKLSGALKLVRAIAKYGWENFEWEVLELCSPEQLTDREEYWIKEFKTTSDEFGYNIHERQEQPKHMKWSEEAKKRVRESGAKKDHFRGRKQTPEARKAMSDKLKGRKFTDEHREKISKNRLAKFANGEMKPVLMSEEARQKISDAWRKRGANPKPKREKLRDNNHKKRRVLLTYVHTQETQEFESRKAAQEQLHLGDKKFTQMIKENIIYQQYTLRYL